MVLLRHKEHEAWSKTPYQIIKLFEYHKEYNPHIFQQEHRRGSTAAVEQQMDDIDIALGGL